MIGVQCWAEAARVRQQIHGWDFCLLAKALKVTWQPLVHPAPFPKTETVNQELEATRRNGRENSWMLLIILWLQAVVSDTCSLLIFVPELPNPIPHPTPPPGWRVTGIMGKRAHRCHSLRIPWLQLVTVNEVTVWCCRDRWSVTVWVPDTQAFHIWLTFPAVSLVDRV